MAVKALWVLLCLGLMLWGVWGFWWGGGGGWGVLAMSASVVAFMASGGWPEIE